MIGWYIAAGILGLILLLLLLPVRVRLRYDGEVFLWIGYGFVMIPILPEKEEESPAEEALPKKKKKKKPKPEKASEEKTAPEEKPSGGLGNKFREIVKYQGVSGLLSLLKDLAEIGAGTLKKLCSHVVLRKFDLLLTLGGEDAAETALLYGKLCGVVYPTVGTIVTACKCRKYGLTVQPDFQSKETLIRLELAGHLLPIFVVVYGLGGLFRIIGRMIRANRELEEAKPPVPQRKP